MLNASLSKYRWQSYTKGENAEVLIAGVQAYTAQPDYKGFQATAADVEVGIFETSVTNSFTDTSAAGGTSGTLPTTNTATIGVAQALIAGQKYFVAQRRDSRCKTTTAIIYDSSRTRRVPYAAPVKQITT